MAYGKMTVGYCTFYVKIKALFFCLIERGLVRHNEKHNFMFWILCSWLGENMKCNLKVNGKKKM